MAGENNEIPSGTGSPAPELEFTLAEAEGVGGVQALSDLDTVATNFYDNYQGEWARRENLFQDGGDIGRIPLIMTTEEMAATGRYIVYWCAPENVQWNLKLRGVAQQVRNGKIQHYFKSSKRNTHYDEAEVSFTFQSGNIMPIRMTSDPSQPISKANTIVRLPFGLLNLYEFLELLDQKRVMSDGRTNYVYILYSSNVFPRIILRGFFNPEGLSFTESAQENGEVKWTSTFTVESTYPRFNSAYSLAQAWREMQQRRGYTVVQRGSAFTEPAQGTTESGA